MRASTIRTALTALAATFLFGSSCSEIDSVVQDDTSLGPIVINEFKGGSGGFVELFNRGASQVDLSGWKVDDVASQGATPKSVGASITIAPGGFLKIPFSGINVASADSVRLIDAKGNLADSHSNFFTPGASISGRCFGRRPDGGSWASSSMPCSPGGANGVGGFLLKGTIVGPSGPFEGEVLVQGDTIQCAAKSCASSPGVASAVVVDTKGIILPGLIDTHNHILFDTFDETDWSPPKTYTNHNQWPSDARYGAMVDAKQYMNGELSTLDLGCEMNKYGELKGVIAWTTSIAGAANPANQVCFSSLARTVDQTPNGLGEDKVQAATLFPTAPKGDAICAGLKSGATESFLVHVAEGVDASSKDELAKLGTVTTTDGCLYTPQTVIIHGTALGEPEMTLMADKGMSLVWSPQSNVFLYGEGTDLTKTTNIPLALEKGINVSLAPDWSIGGSQNILDELRFAKRVGDDIWNGALSAEELFEMVTINPATALGLGDVLGSIEPGKKADLLVISGNRAAPYDALLAATPKEVRLTMVGGVVLYGDSTLQALGAASPGCEKIDVCGAKKFVCVATENGSEANKLGQTLAEIRTALEDGIKGYDDLNLTQWNFAPIAPLVKCN